MIQYKAAEENIYKVCELAYASYELMHQLKSVCYLFDRLGCYFCRNYLFRCWLS